MKYGKLIDYTKNGNAITLNFENQKVIISAITDNILRVLVPSFMEDCESVAIEGDKSQPCQLEVRKTKTGLEIATSHIKLDVADDFVTEFTDMAGNCLMRDYEAPRKLLNKSSEQIKKILEAEGHDTSNMDARNYKVQTVKVLEDEDCFYGLGDKTGFLNKRGFTYENWNSDIPQLHHENMPALYKSIPFLICKKAKSVYGLFFDNTFHSYIDLGKEDPSYFFYGADDGNLDYYFIAGDHMTDIIREYTYLTGRSPLPQLWTLGYHQCRWGYECAEDIRGVAHKMREYKIPCESVQYDIDYMDAYKVFTWNTKHYEAPGNLMAELKQQGFKPIVIVDPGVKKEPGYFMYDEGMANDYFAHGADDKVYENVVWPGESVYPDFGKAEVRSWWGKAHRILTDWGVEAIWNDMNEPASFIGPLPLDVKFSVNDRLTTHAEAHNTYGHFMGKATYEGMREHTGKRPTVITRACYAGSQKYTAVWTGDNQSVWAHLQMLVPQLCNLGMSGFAIAGTDIGGFGGDANPELSTRWVEAATFSTFFRNHSAKGNRMQEPWVFGDKYTDIYRKYVELHYQFLPYIYDLLYKCQSTGLPVMRPLVLHYENDKNVLNINDEFLVGENILVAPVLSQGVTKRMVYLPEGTWYDYNTHKRYEGENYIIVDAPLDTLPMFIKAGALIPTYEVMQYVGEREYDKLILLSTPEKSACEHYQDNGVDYECENGEYNLYSFTHDGNGSLKTSMLHEGYTLYKSIELKIIK